MADATLVKNMPRTRNHVVRSQTPSIEDILDQRTIRVNLCYSIVTDLRRKTFERAVKLLAARPRSVAELRERLLRGKNTNEEIVETVIARLREYGYLNDERFAFSYASYKVKQKPVGRRRLERDLKFKKVDSSVANEALEMVYNETPEEMFIDQAIAKRLRIRGKPKNRLEAKSLFDHLLRQGFEFELVSEKIRSLTTDDTDEVNSNGL